MFTTGRLAALASISLAALAMTALAADVTYERLLNAPNEPDNWLMVHRDYNNSRHSPLTQINAANAKDLKPKFIMSIGGRATGGTLRGKEESTPLVDDGFMYVADTWTRVTKFDVRSGSEAVPLWRYDPKIKQARTNRGIALYGNKVLISTNDMRLIAVNRDSGELIWEVDAKAPTDPATGTPSPKTQGFTGAPVVIKTKGGKELVLQGESTGGQLGTRSWVGAWDVNDGKLAWRTFTIPAPGEPGSESWKDNHNAWRVGGGGVWQSASYDPATNLLYYGTGDAFPSFDPQFRPGDNLFTASTIALHAKRMIAYVAGAEGCISSTAVKTPMDDKKDYVGLPPCCTEQGRVTAHGALWAMDLRTGKIVNKATFQPPTESGMLSTDGGLLFTGHMTGKFAAYDAETLKEVYSFNLGTPITAPPMTYSVGGKQYIAVVAGAGVGVRGQGLYQPSAFVAVFGL